MKLKPLDALLIAGIVLGGVLAWRTVAERIRLEERCARLARLAGDRPIKHGTKVHIMALGTVKASHLAWRIHLPLYYESSRSYEGASYPPLLREGDVLARVRFRETDGLRIYTNLRNVAASAGLGDEKREELLRGRWDKLHVEQLGLKDMEHVDTKGSAVLLRLELPPGMRVVGGID